MNYYKILGPNGRPFHGGKGRWHLPQGRRPGRWMPRIKELIPCAWGYHVVRRSRVLEWLGPEIWVCEIDGRRIIYDDNIVVERARLLYKVGGWDKKSQKAFAHDCATHAAAGGNTSRTVAPAAFIAARNAVHAVANRISGVGGLSWFTTVAGDANNKAFAAERSWQTNRLFRKYLTVSPPWL